VSDPHKPASDLKKVNERLRELADSLRQERDRLSADVRARTHLPVSPAAEEPDAAQPVDLEKRRLASELAGAREAAQHANEERDRLRAQLEELERDHGRICDEYVAIQEKTTELAQLYVALERIHGGLSRGETLGALQEIVINVIGSEELVVLERRSDRLVLLQSFGVDPEPWRDVPADRGAVGTAAAGAPWVAGKDGAAPRGPGEEDLTAAIPLRFGAEVVGVLAIFRLLGHKPVLGETDDRLFDLLSSHAGVALRLRAAPGPRAA
jgi:hypothetical protein